MNIKRKFHIIIYDQTIKQGFNKKKFEICMLDANI